MSDIEALERKTFIEYCTFLERYLERVEAQEQQIKELQDKQPPAARGKRSNTKRKP